MFFRLEKWRMLYGLVQNICICKIFLTHKIIFSKSQTRVKISKILASIAYKIFFLRKKRVSVKNISKKCHTMKRRINMVVTLLKISWFIPDKNKIPLTKYFRYRSALLPTLTAVLAINYWLISFQFFHKWPEMFLSGFIVVESKLGVLLFQYPLTFLQNVSFSDSK